MTNFAVPSPGQVITVTTRYADHYYKREKDYKDTTYENVPVIEDPLNRKNLKGTHFCIPAEGEPFITFRTIKIDSVVDLTVNGKVGEVATSTNTEIKKIPGGKGKVYNVTLVDGIAVKCECLGFQYRGQCRHLRIAMGETPVNPRRETIKKAQRKAAAKKRKPRSGGPTKADQVRDIIRARKLVMQNFDHDTTVIAQGWCVADAVEKIGMSRGLATTYVKNNWSKV